MSDERILENKEEKVKELTFFDHLEELRWHLFRSVLVILLFGIVAFIFKRVIFDIIILSPKEPDFYTNVMLCRLGDIIGKDILCINTNPVQIINITMAGQFLTHIKISLLAGFFASFPYVIYETWRFIKPALYKSEKKIAGRTVVYISLLFFFGVLLGYFLIVPLSMNFLSNYSVSDSIVNNINLSSYISNLSSICFASGIVFELPIVTYFLSKLGILTPQIMRQYRRHAFIGILILSAILTPPDIMSQVLIALPLVILYEFSIRISRNVIRKKQE
ncbi:twin-arginine translocase subunit TatC [Bacteroidota bacterium]